jgi:hypothetical protein
VALIGEFEAAVREADPEREPDQFRLCGELFTVSERNLDVPFMRFAKIAQTGADSASSEGLAAIFDLVTTVVVDEERERFLETATRRGVDSEVLMEIVKVIVEARAARPTRQPSASSDGLSTIGESSKASSPFGEVPPIQLDPRVRELKSVEAASLSLVG